MLTKDEKIKKNIGKNIQSSREKNEITRNKLAEKMYTEADTVKKWEKGKNLPSILTIHELSKQLNEPALHLMGYDNEKPKLTEFPFFFTEEQEQCFWMMKKLNPNYLIETFWLDIVLPARKSELNNMGVVDKVANLLYNNAEKRRYFSANTMDIMSRMKDMMHPMRFFDKAQNDGEHSIKIQDDGKYLYIFLDDEEIFREKPENNEWEQMSLAGWFLIFLDKFMKEQKRKLSPNEYMLLIQLFNQTVGRRVFECADIIIDPHIKDDKLTVNVLIPNEILFPRKLTDCLYEEYAIITHKGFYRKTYDFRLPECDERLEEYIVGIFDSTYALLMITERVLIEKKAYLPFLDMQDTALELYLYALINETLLFCIRNKESLQSKQKGK